ncbi:putative RNA methyltransferase [Brumicola nitratireducens]|uniref:rRNA (Guanine-N1-)-methyltransferase n=1 Tax=Glaciecola nitratireducens (strain JCM 12485 / KCTC 12276 / FR1064) TaxID=1085623 RepID=G4QLJ8_GLANF|nr:rRNA (guanine-N1-)-methyltransferase [Glaciecola nitratireducens FR1064]
MWQCPLCKLPLKTHQDDALNSPLKTWSCDNNHTFDKAKQGYVNLLPVQNKRSKMPGDDAEMVAARTTFFAEKPYQALVVKLSNVISDIMLANSNDFEVLRNPDNPPGSPVMVYDSGCGEGYYIDELSKLLLDPDVNHNSTNYSFAGHDISKAAVIAAAKRNKDKQLVVASTINIPVLHHSQDVILQVFAPACASEYARVLRSNGIVITVDPGAKHLFELKELVYENPQLHEENAANLSSFEIAERHQLNFCVALSSPEVRSALLQMTPFYWKTNAQQRALIQQELLQVTADFTITVWQLNKSSAALQNASEADLLTSDANKTKVSQDSCAETEGGL